MNIEYNELMVNDIESRRAFLFTLEWLLALMKRYSSPLQFGLVHIEYGSNHELGETFGVHEVFKQLASLTASLTSAFRKTDIVGRDVTDFWVIVPYTAENEKLHDKIFSVLQDAKHKGLNVVDREISIFSLPLASTATEAQDAPVEALKFLEYLKENKQHFASHVFRLSASQK